MMPDSVRLEVDRATRVTRDRFRVKVNPKMVQAVMEALKPAFSEEFSLPEHWRFSRYSLRELKSVYTAIKSVAGIHFMARLAAIQRGCSGLGFRDSVAVFERDELIPPGSQPQRTATPSGPPALPTT